MQLGIYERNWLHFCDGNLRKDSFGELMGAMNTINHMVYRSPTGGKTIDRHDYVDTMLMEKREDIIESLKTICSFMNINPDELNPISQDCLQFHDY